jgi:gluconolactonase
VTDVTVIARNLRKPEGPVLMDDGSVVVAEIEAGDVTRVRQDGSRDTIAHVGGGPNGLALGPSGHIFVCNNGGRWPDRYTQGSIERIDLTSGEVDTLYDSCDGRPLCGPNDLAFDTDGGFWFTDHGKARGRERDVGSVYYASGSGDLIREEIFPVNAPNGIGISNDGALLCFAETFTGRLFTRQIVGPGRLARSDDTDPLTPPGHLICGLPGLQLFDSLAIHPDGTVCVGTLISSRITVVDVHGEFWWQLSLSDDLRDPVLSNLCFTPDGHTAYATLTSFGLLVRFEWPLAPS